MANNAITIVFNNAVRCSGMCSYCTVANQVHYQQGVNTADLEKSVRRVNEQASQLIQVDYNRLADAILKHPLLNKEGTSFSIWGADPLNSFDSFVDLYEFLEELCKEHGIKFNGCHGSTNGLAFVVPEWVDWLQEHSSKLRFQLSHDGLGQFIRTRDFDPLSLTVTKDLMKSGMINYLSCVLNFYNPSPKSNIKFFHDSLGELFSSGKVQARIYTVRSADYDVTALNTMGIWNGKAYSQLVNQPFGDLDIHNDEALAEKYSIFEMAHAADIHFDEWEDIYKHIDNQYYLPIRRVAIQRVAYNSKKYSEIVNGIPNYPRPACAKYHTGQQDWSNCIDTLGKYTPCHLLDGDMPIANPTFEKPDFCKQCKYNDRWECNVCGAFKLNTKYCQWSYRFNQQMDRLKESPWIQDWVRAYGRHWTNNPKEVHNANNTRSRQSEVSKQQHNCNCGAKVTRS